MKGITGGKALMFALAGALIAGVLALAGCACSAQSSSSSSAGADQYTVPNVISLTQADAEKAILASGLRLGSVTREASDTVPAGAVISQNPQALTSAEPNSKVDIVISTGKVAAKDVTVPDLKGKTQADAKKALSDVGLVGVASNPEESTEVEPGQVFKQSVAAGTTVKEGTKVAFTVAVAPGETEVPNVVGKSRDDAKKSIEGAKLTFDYTVAYNDNVSKDTVISQSVSAGTKVKTGSEVSVVVSLGPAPTQDVEVPDVTSYSWSDAESALHSAGLAARYTGDPAGVVTAQDIAPGTKVAPNTLVTVTLSSPTQYVEVPNLIGMSVSAAEDATDQVGLALDIDGDDSGKVVDQWPDAGTQVEVRSTVRVTVQADTPSWTSASSASDAAKGAGINSFSVQDSVTIGDNMFSKPRFAYTNGIAQATYEGGASQVVVRKGAGAAGTVIPGELPSFVQKWTQNIKGLTVNCNGDSQDAATYISWNVDNDAYSVYYQGLGGETVSMTADDVQSLVNAIQ